MNIAFDPWIPVVSTNGTPELASLYEILAEGEKFADLAVRPHERVALMRLLLCVAHAALDGPKDYDEWCEVPKRLPETVRKYLSKWKDSFEIFHKKIPWLQVAGLSSNASALPFLDGSSGWTPVSKLNFSFATGSNATLFDHEGAMSQERSIPLTETIVSMLAYQNFTVGGLMGQVFWNGDRCGELANPKKLNGPVKSSDGPCVPASMVHAFLRKNNILGTIHFNLPTHEDVKFSYGVQDFGMPLWEMLPTSLNDFNRINNATRTYLGRLTPLTRLILLHPSGNTMLLGNGFSYPTFANGFPPEPSATVVIHKDERALLSYRPSKAIWRELAAVIVKRKAEGTGGPLSLCAIQDGLDCDLVVAALARNKATIVDTVESVFQIPSRLRTTEGASTYESEVKIAESIARRLGWAVEDYRREIDGGWEGRLKGAGPAKGELKAKLHANVTIYYWTTVEKNLDLLMNHIKVIGSDDAIPLRDKWRKMLFSTACEAYRTVCGQETPRQIKAFAKGWQKLLKKKDETETTEENKEVAA